MERLSPYCANCGAANTPDAVTCFACGRSLDEAAPQPAVRLGPLAPGSLLHHRYLIVSQVGTGGYGAVYKAQDTQNQNRLIALKEINLHGLKPHEVIEATDTFNREVMLLSDLKHTNLPRVYDHFTDPIHWYLVMDFIEGETLEEYLKRLPTAHLSLDKVLDIGLQLCTVLDYLHHRHPPIIFRDLKPANVMRTFNGHIYLIDFGTARHLKPGQPKDTIALGSPGYAAPEQYGKAQTTQQSDIYSLGATLHHLLTGDDPAENPFHLAPLCTLDATHPADLETLIADMLSLDASERPASIATVKQELERIKEEQLKIRLEASYPALSPSQGQVAAMANQVVRPTPSLAVSRKAVTNAVAGIVAVLIAVASCSFCVTLTRFPHRDGPVAIMPHAPLSKQVLHSPLIGSASHLILDPAHASDLQSRQVVNMLLTGLVSLDDQLRVSPQLASSYDLSADGRSITFHLRPNLKFQDGNTLTSRDVAFSLDRALQPAIHSATCMTYLGLIQDADKLHNGQISTLINDSILLPDEQTLVLKLRQSAPYFLTALAYPCSYVLEERLLLQYANTGLAKVLKAGGGAGPFILSSYTDSELDLTVNANYYGPKPQLQEVVFSFYRDTEATYQAYRAGMIDTTALPADMLNSSNLYNWRRVSELTTYYYAMNYLVKPFDNIHIRQALDLAIDKELLVQAVWHKAFLPTCNIVPLGMPGHNPSLTCPDGQNTANGNPAQAKNSLAQGLQEEGYSSMSQLPPITFTYVNDSPSFNKEVAVVRQMWKNVLGIDIKAKSVSASTLREEIAASVGNVHGLQLWATSWSADYPDPHDLLTLQFDKNSPYNDVNYGQNSSSDAAQQQALQQQLEVADTNSDPVLRQQAFMNAEQQLVNDVAWMPMYQEVSTILLATYVVGTPYNLGFVIPPNDWGNVYIAAH